MKSEPMDADIQVILRRSLSRGAGKIPVPDLWPGVRTRINSNRRTGWWRKLMRPVPTPGWLAPAGTVAFVVVLVIASVLLINDPSNDRGSESKAAQPIDAGQSPSIAEQQMADEEAFIGALRKLESAGPFAVESESVIPSQSVGGSIDMMLPPYSSESLFWQTFPNAATEGMPEGFGTGDDLEDRNCTEFTSGRICDKVWTPSGETLGISIYHGAMYSSKSIFVSADEYRTRSNFILDPELKSEITRRGGRSDFSLSESTHDIRQEDGQFYFHDGLNWSPSPIAEVIEGKPAEGSLYAFLMTHLTLVHLYQFLDFSPKNLVDAANFSNIERITPLGETNGEGLVHYESSISGFFGDEGIWSMWVSPDDGLPRRISIEAFTPVKGSLNVARATLKFSHFGEEIGIYDLQFLF